MKITPINRINILINTHANTHRTYLYNEMMDLSRKYKFGGEFGRDYISLKSMPETALKILEELKIKFEKLK